MTFVTSDAVAWAPFSSSAARPSRMVGQALPNNVAGAVRDRNAAEQWLPPSGRSGQALEDERESVNGLIEIRQCVYVLVTISR